MKRTPSLLFSVLGILLPWTASRGFAQSIRPGTEIRVHLLNKLSTGEVKEGQSFSAILAEPVSLGSTKVLASGARVRVMVIGAVRSGGLKRPASITLVLTSVDKTLVQTKALQIDAKSHVVRRAATIGARAGTGTGAAYVTDEKGIVLAPEMELDFVIADSRSTLMGAPEPVVARTIDRVPESRPAIWRGDSREAGDDAYDALIFSERDKWLIHSYVKSNYGNLPPGLARRAGALSSSLEKHLRSDGTLPPSLQSLVEPLPEELARQLPRLPPGYSRGVLSGRVLILADDGQIVDLMFTDR